MMKKKASYDIIGCIIGFLIGGLLFSSTVCFGEQKKDISTGEGVGKDVSGGEVEISVFTTKEEAEKLAQKIKNSGFETFVRQHKTDDEKTVFGVFVKIHSETPQGGPIPPSTVARDAEGPVGTKRTPKDVFSRSASYVHAGVTVSEIYTDNAYNTKTDKKSDLSTVLSPSVWISVPRLNEQPVGLDLITPRSSGGLSFSRMGMEDVRHYQAFLSYHSDIPITHSANSPSGNMVTQNVQGGVAYSFPFGLYLELNDEFSRYYETADTSVLVAPGETDKYNSNLFYAMLTYDTGNKLWLRFDYSNFLLTYDAERNSLRDRVDNSFSAYLFYRLRPKASLFFEYAFTDVGYTNDDRLNGTEQSFFIGAMWKFTAKSNGSVRAGYGLRDFADAGANNTKNFIFEGNIEHRFTPRTSLKLTVSRRTDETNIPSTYYVLTDEVGLEYQQMLTSNITGTLGARYSNESYGADLTYRDLTAKRNDNIYQFSAGLQYDFRKRLKAGIYYIYTIRNSNFPDFNYSNNTVLLKLTGWL